jgi:RNA polymerase sigma-70 factor (ECF subfamily)
MSSLTAPPPTPRVTDPGAADRLRELYDLHAADVYRIAYRLTGSAPDAEDVVQDLFVGLPEAIRGYAERGRMGAWIRTVATRMSLNRLRWRRRRQEVPIDGAAEAAAPCAAERSIDTIDIQRALDLLPDTLRAVLVLREIEGCSHQEIARTLGIRVGASRVRLHRAREEMRQLLTRPS